MVELVAGIYLLLHTDAWNRTPVHSCRTRYRLSGYQTGLYRTAWYLPFYIHVFTAILALPAGFTQFQKKLRRKHPAVHRFNGRVYVFMILLFGAPSGLVIGVYANGGSLHRSPLCCWPCCGGGSPGRLLKAKRIIQGAPYLHDQEFRSDLCRPLPCGHGSM